jgi:hypothetical protein
MSLRVLARHPVGVDREKGREGAARTSLLPVASVISTERECRARLCGRGPLYRDVRPVRAPIRDNSPAVRRFADIDADSVIGPDPLLVHSVELTLECRG